MSVKKINLLLSSFMTVVTTKPLSIYLDYGFLGKLKHLSPEVSKKFLGKRTRVFLISESIRHNNTKTRVDFA